MERAFADCMVAEMVSRLHYKAPQNWAPEVRQLRLTKEIAAVDEARLVSQAAKEAVDASVEYRCLRLAREDVKSTVGVHWVPPAIMVETFLARYLAMVNESGCVEEVLNDGKPATSAL